MNSINSLNASGFALLAALLLPLGWIVPDKSARRWKLRLMITVMAAALLGAAWWENERRLEAFYELHRREYLEYKVKENRRVRQAMHSFFEQFQERMSELPESQQADVAERIPPKLVELLQSSE